METAVMFHLGHQFGDQRALELNNVPAGGANQMVVFCRVFYLVVTMNVV
jgi:hypothetical protein